MSLLALCTLTSFVGGIVLLAWAIVQLHRRPTHGGRFGPWRYAAMAAAGILAIMLPGMFDLTQGCGPVLETAMQASVF